MNKLKARYYIRDILPNDRRLHWAILIMMNPSAYDIKELRRYIKDEAYFVFERNLTMNEIAQVKPVYHTQPTLVSRLKCYRFYDWQSLINHHRATIPDFSSTIRMIHYLSSISRHIPQDKVAHLSQLD